MSKLWLGILATNQTEVRMLLILELPDAVVTFQERPGAGGTGPSSIQLAHDIHRHRTDRLNI